MRNGTALVFCLLLTTAGCSGLVGNSDSESQPTPPTTTVAESTTPIATTTTSDGITIQQRGAVLGDINPNIVWNRVGDLVSIDAPTKPTVIVKPLTANPVDYEPSPFYRSLGVTNSNYRSVNTTVTAQWSGDEYTVTVWRSPNASDAHVESVLAHEFAHVYQSKIPSAQSENGSVLSRAAVREGGAELIEWRYADKYVTGFDPESKLVKEFQRMWAIQRISRWSYLYGGRYARNFSDPEAPMRTLSDNPPTTAEQVLHGLQPGSESPKPLSVTGISSQGWSWDRRSTERYGEPPIRYALQIGVTRERAAEAAAGWGNDRWTRFVSGDGYGYAWTVRWDTVQDASEFRKAFTAFEANVSEPLALQTVGNETTVLVSGPKSFVRNVSVSGTPSNVTIST